LARFYRGRLREMRDRTASCYSLPRLAIAKGFHMRSLHSRPVCRAHNTFSPSVALWQHFIIPNQHLLQRRFLSSSTTKRSSIDGSLEPTETRGTNGSDLASPVETPPKVRLIRTGVGKFLVNHSLFSKYRKNPKRKQTELPEARQPPGARQPETPPEAEKLWALVRQAYNSAEDYKGVSVQPMRTHVQVSESKLPWTVKNQKSLSGEDR
jgi:non-canonical poly(A) RNA polymerase PAPD5/7